MDEHPLTITVDSSARLNINLSDEQLKEVARQVAEILKEEPK
jgi:hypothetical protein